jgi:hypothetical protein
MLFNIDKKLRQRAISVTSMTSRTSDVANDVEVIEHGIQLKRKLCRRPFMFKILQLNSPEAHWIVLGCITSILFGCVSPVNPYQLI